MDSYWDVYIAPTHLTRWASIQEPFLYISSSQYGGASLVTQTIVFLQYRIPRVDLWVGKIPGRREWQPTLGFLPGECHGQRNLVDYSPWNRKESDMTEHLPLSLPPTWKSSLFTGAISWDSENKIAGVGSQVVWKKPAETEVWSIILDLVILGHYPT